MEKWDELKPEGKKLEMYHKLSNSNQESSIMVVGHEPYLSTMISEIVFGDNDMNNNNNNSIILKKAGLAKIDLKSFEPKISGELVWLLTPKHLKKIASAK
jgi:phosphohistidine phosphatase